MKIGKKFVLAGTAALLLGALAGCSGSKYHDFTVCLASEPDTIDPALNSAVDGATLLVHLDSGLVRYVQDPADGSLYLDNDLASDIKIERDVEVTDFDGTKGEDGKYTWEEHKYADGVRYTVTLREGIKWSDGSAITADDFIYSWNRAASAKLGGDYCYMFEPIAGGVAKETDDSHDLGLTKVSDRVFTIDCMTEVSYFDQLLAFPTYFPVQKATVEKNDTKADGAWATDPKTYVSCGAYILDDWKHNSYIKLVKNPNYWNAANITMPSITFALSDKDEAILASYQKGAYDFIDSVPNEQIKDIEKNYKNEFKVTGQMGTYYISFNMNSKKWDAVCGTGVAGEANRVKVRKALGLFINRQYIVDEIGQAKQIPANAFVSAGISDAIPGEEFVDNNGPERDGAGYYDKGATTDAYNANVAKAIALLKEVGFKYDDATKKFTDFPAFTYLYNTSSGHKAIAENLADTWGKYGINANLENQEWASFLNTRKDGQYDVARNGWVADYDDPSSYLTMWTTASGNNDSQFGKGDHEKYAIYEADVNRDGVKETGLTWAQSYDVLVDMSNKESDKEDRFELLHEIEDLLMETGGICPIYYYTDIFMIKPTIKGFFSSPLGYKFFMYCTVASDQVPNA